MSVQLRGLSGTRIDRQHHAQKLTECDESDLQLEHVHLACRQLY